MLTVDSSGNVTAKGTLSGVQTAGSVRLVAGTAFDGTVLPLPAGVDQATIDSGGLEVSVLVTPAPARPDLGADHRPVFLPVRCEVDADRRVSCKGRGSLRAPPAATTRRLRATSSWSFPFRERGAVSDPQMTVLHLSTGHVVSAVAAGKLSPTVDDLTGGTAIAVRVEDKFVS